VASLPYGRTYRCGTAVGLARSDGDDLGAHMDRRIKPSAPAFRRLRPLEARPSLNQKANYREWIDPSIGAWPGNAVGKCWKRGGCLGYQIRLDLVLKVSAQERCSCQWWD